MKYYLAFDDTDIVGADRGTGKLARWFEDSLPDGFVLHGVVRQQLLVAEGVPYTSHNSAACLILDGAEHESLDRLVEAAVSHIQKHYIVGSDPGLCVAREDLMDFSAVISFGQECTRIHRTRKDALNACSSVHLSGHGGTEDGIIGALAAVGLTAWGWSGRFIEYGSRRRLRDFPQLVSVGDLASEGIKTVTVDRDAPLPAPDDMVQTNGWLRPRLWGGTPVVVTSLGKDGVWHSFGEKRRKQKSGEVEMAAAN